MSELWQYRELTWNLTIVDLKNRYQNTAIGFFWSLLSPLLMALVLYFVFRYLFEQEPNFAAYLLVGLMSWRFFAIGTTAAVFSVASKASLVTKVYVPRKILVISNIVANLISSLVEFIIIIPILYFISGGLPPTLILFPLVFLIYFWFIYGIGLFLASMYIYLRDLNQIWEVISSTLFFLSPVFYPMSAIKGTMPIYLLNPITEFIIIFRDLMLYNRLPSLYSLFIVCVASLLSFIIGTIVFNRLQRGFAEEI
jgi:lipopolysaccharide transport system permease protein